MKLSKVIGLILMIGALTLPSANATRFSLLGGVNLPQMADVSASLSGLTSTTSFDLSYQGGALA